MGGAVALGTAVLLLAFAAGRGPQALFWTLTGWSVMALTGVAGGAWTEAKLGTAGTGFLLSLVASILARLFASAIGAGFALWAGERAAIAYLVGLGASFGTQLIFELVWFVRRSRQMGSATTC
jgi:hypothetical protein